MAWADCTITVKGDGHGSYGAPKADRTAPLRELLVFNQAIFKSVREHLKSCGRCDVDEVVREYLGRLRDPRCKTASGAFSGTVMNHIQSLDRMARKRGRGVDPHLMNQALMRSADYSDIIAISGRLSAQEVAQCIRFHQGRKEGYRFLQQLCGQVRAFGVVHDILAGGGRKRPPSAAELEELLSVADVMLS